MKKHLILILLIFLGFSICQIEIINCSQLTQIQLNDSSASYYLGANLICNSISPRGSSTNPFRGTLDGRGYSLRITMTTASNGGLFGYCSGSNIFNLNLDSCYLLIDGGGSKNINALLCAVAQNSTFSQINVKNGYINSGRNTVFRVGFIGISFFYFLKH